MSGKKIVVIENVEETNARYAAQGLMPPYFIFEPIQNQYPSLIRLPKELEKLLSK